MQQVNKTVNRYKLIYHIENIAIWFSMTLQNFLKILFDEILSKIIIIYWRQIKQSADNILCG
jgi:hypothetical protein